MRAGGHGVQDADAAGAAGRAAGRRANAVRAASWRDCAGCGRVGGLHTGDAGGGWLQPVGLGSILAGGAAVGEGRDGLPGGVGAGRPQPPSPVRAGLAGARLPASLPERRALHVARHHAAHTVPGKAPRGVLRQTPPLGVECRCRGKSESLVKVHAAAGFKCRVPPAAAPHGGGLQGAARCWPPWQRAVAAAGSFPRASAAPTTRALRDSG